MGTGRQQEGAERSLRLKQRNQEHLTLSKPFTFCFNLAQKFCKPLMNPDLLTRDRSETESLFLSIQATQEIPSAYYSSRNLIRSVSKSAFQDNSVPL
jgi:hypothetical protein